MKHFNQVRKYGAKVVAGLGLLSLPFVASATPTGPDWSTLTDAIDFGDMGVGLLAAGAALIGVYLLIKGVRIIMSFVRS